MEAITTTSVATWDDAVTEPIVWITPSGSVGGTLSTLKQEPIKTHHIRSTARVHRATIETKDTSKLMTEIKHKLIKDLVRQLESTPNAIRIIKTTNPKTYSVTFEAIIEYVPQ